MNWMSERVWILLERHLLFFHFKLNCLMLRDNCIFNTLSELICCTMKFIWIVKIFIFFSLVHYVVDHCSEERLAANLFDSEACPDNF